MLEIQITLEDFGVWESIKNNPIGNAIRRALLKIGVEAKVWVHQNASIAIMVDDLFTYIDYTPEMADIARRDSCDIFEIELYSEIN